MYKLIYKKFNKDLFLFFASSLFVMGIIVWTIQAVNYFDFVTKDGHGIKVYFFYTVLNFPKIIHRILPFIYFISLYYMILRYETKNELNLLWVNGVRKKKFIKSLLKISLVLFFIQIFLGAYISPLSQLKAREYLKTSNVDFFTSLISEGKFINVVQDLTIFINNRNKNNTFSQIFLEDSSKNNRKMIYAKKGLINESSNNKIFELIDGQVINFDNEKINVFKFDKIKFDLSEYSSNTITVPKIQEIRSIDLVSCYLPYFKSTAQTFKCQTSLIDEINQEILKRFYKPIYIIIITILCCFIITKSNYSIDFKKNNNQIFFITFLLILFSETMLRYSTSSNLSFYVFIAAPIIIYLFFYIMLIFKIKNV